MSLLSALYTGVSGLQTFGDTLQVIGDNIANVNTVGFKASRAEFADVLSQTINVSSGRSQLGRGVTLERISSNFAQGSFSNTDRLTDLGISGNGFFIVSNGAQQFYTRNGQFTINRSGELVTSGGLQLMGYPLGSSDQRLQVLRINNSISQPRQTGNGTGGGGVVIQANLNAGDTIHSNFSAADPSGTSNFSTSVTVYDSRGQAHVVGVYFNKTAENAWSWHALVDGGELTGGTAGAFTESASGTLTFNGQGALASSTTTSSSFNFRGTDAAQTIGFNFGDSIASGGTGLTGSTQFAGASVIRSQSQDGYASGSLASISINDDGVITGAYTNGRTIQVGQIALAQIPNLQGLNKAGSGVYTTTVDSGEATANRPNTGGLGTIASYSLELSNVDLATEFVNLIATQRAYQANSKIITVGDQLLSDIVNIIR